MKDFIDLSWKSVGTYFFIMICLIIHTALPQVLQLMSATTISTMKTKRGACNMLMVIARNIELFSICLFK